MIGVRIAGGAELAKILKSLPDRLSRNVKVKALMAGGEPIRSRAAANAPVEPGKPDLADHIVLAPVRRTSEDIEAGAASVGIGVPKQFFYDTFQEFGTSHHGAQPFYRPALDGEGRRAIGIIGGELWAATIRGGFTSARIPQGPGESFGGPKAPSVSGGPGGGLL